VNVGSRFDDRVTGKVSTFAPHARIVHVDVDPSEIGKLVPVAVGIVGDARAVLSALREEAGLGTGDSAPGGGESRARTPADARAESRAAWIDEVHRLRDEFEPRQAYRRRPDTDVLQPHDVYAALNAALATPRPARVVTDVGQHQMWTAQLLDWRHPRSHITSGGAGTMGFAVPAALGAAMACPGETIWAVCGDGGFQMTNQELATMRQEGVANVKVAIINNGYLGMVRQWQELFEGKRYSATPLSGPDFAKLAEAYGVRGMTVDSPHDVDAAIAEAWAHDGPVVIDFRVEQEANVFPMVPAGRSIGEQMLDATTTASTS
jgi:acetolactate synthase-1/2/3 large subunit